MRRNRKNRKRILVGIIALFLILGMILPILTSVFAEEVNEVKKASIFTNPWLYIISGIILLVVSFILKIKDDKRPKDPLENVRFLKDYRKKKEKR